MKEQLLALSFWLQVQTRNEICFIGELRSHTHFHSCLVSLFDRSLAFGRINQVSRALRLLNFKRSVIVVLIKVKFAVILRSKAFLEGWELVVVRCMSLAFPVKEIAKWLGLVNDDISFLDKGVLDGWNFSLKFNIWSVSFIWEAAAFGRSLALYWLNSLNCLDKGPLCLRLRSDEALANCLHRLLRHMSVMLCLRCWPIFGVDWAT